MATREVKLEEEEWQQVMNALIAQYPLLMKLASQLREQQEAEGKAESAAPRRLDSNGKEVRS